MTSSLGADRRAAPSRPDGAGRTARRAVPTCGLAMIRRFEGLHDGDRRTPILLEPMKCPAGIYTVGWGYALFEGGKPVRAPAQAMRIWRERWPEGFTLADADALLRSVAQAVCDDVVRLCPVALNDHELGALVSLAYNIGVGEPGGVADFADSTVRRKLLAGDRAGAAAAFSMWKYVAGKVSNGLVNRRRAEAELFLRPV